MNKHYDIAVIGGGLAGLTQAILLGQQGWSLVCIDREKAELQTDDDYDTRTTAISWGSRNLLTHAGVWEHLESRAEPIRKIHIMDEDSPVKLDFDVKDVNAEAFGWIVDNRDFRRALIDRLQKIETVDHLTGTAVSEFIQNTDKVSVKTISDTFEVKLVIGADGRNSLTREAMGIGAMEKDYNQSGIVCLIEHEKPHNGVAIEHFRSQGPFAVLPFTDTKSNKHRSAIVWTVNRQDADSWIKCSEELFNAALQTRCGDIFGTVKLSGKRAAWPLNLRKAYYYTTDRMVLIAEAAHGMHPIAGQGLNMSLRDIAALTEVLEGARDPGDAGLLKKYQSMRIGDNIGMVLATDWLNTLFGLDIAAVRAVRRFGLHAVARLPFAKKFFMKQAMGAAGKLPAMIRQPAQQALANSA